MTARVRALVAMVLGLAMVGAVIAAGAMEPLATASTMVTATTSPTTTSGNYPSITFTPADGLRNGSVIDIRGQNYPPNAYPVSVIECQLAQLGTDDCAALTLRVTRADAQGSLHVAKYRVTQHITTLAGRKVDCAIENCQLSVQDLAHFPQLIGAIAPLPFGPPIHVHASLVSHVLRHSTGPDEVVARLSVTCSRAASVFAFGDLAVAGTLVSGVGSGACGTSAGPLAFTITGAAPIAHGPADLSVDVSADAGSTRGDASINTPVTIK